MSSSDLDVGSFIEVTLSKFCAWHKLKRGNGRELKPPYDVVMCWKAELGFGLGAGFRLGVENVQKYRRIPLVEYILSYELTPIHMGQNLEP